jgi:transcriptional regulator with XRE-family HTH domain
MTILFSKVDRKEEDDMPKEMKRHRKKSFEKLRNEMYAQDYNVEDLAEAIGMCTTALYNRLCGKIDFRVKEMRAICKVLHAGIDIFFDEIVSKSEQTA